jgi:hypothetical protein
MNSTGYSLLGKLLITALRPMPRQASPNPVYKVSLYLSLMPLFITAPAMLPMIIVQVFMIVPIIVLNVFVHIWW